MFGGPGGLSHCSIVGYCCSRRSHLQPLFRRAAAADVPRRSLSASPVPRRSSRRRRGGFYFSLSIVFGLFRPGHFLSPPLLTTVRVASRSHARQRSTHSHPTRRNTREHEIRRRPAQGLQNETNTQATEVHKNTRDSKKHVPSTRDKTQKQTQKHARQTKLSTHTNTHRTRKTKKKRAKHARQRNAHIACNGGELTTHSYKKGRQDSATIRT